MSSKGILLEARGIMYYPLIGGCLGVCEAMLIQQVHFRCKASGHTKEGYLWMWNSLREWAEELHMGKSTVQRAIYHLTDLGILITGNFNKMKYDNTKWYRLDYGKLGSELEKHYIGRYEIVIDGMLKMGMPLTQKEQPHLPIKSKPIPEMYPEMSPEIPTGPTGEKQFGKIKMKTNQSAREVHAGLLDNFKAGKAAKAGKGSPYKNSAHTLEFTWKNTVPKLEGGSGYVPSFTLAQKGMLGRLCKIWGPESEQILPCVLNNWIDYTKFVATQCGITKTPDAPKLEFLVKFANEAASYNKLKSVQLIAPRVKSKIVVVKKPKPVVAVVKEKEDQAGLEDIMMYLK